jgi:hypothetical protein
MALSSPSPMDCRFLPRNTTEVGRNRASAAPQEEARHPRAIATAVVGLADQGFLLVKVSHHHPQRRPRIKRRSRRPPLVGMRQQEGKRYTFRCCGDGRRSTRHATTATHRRLDTHAAKGDGARPQTPLAAVVDIATPPEAAAPSPKRTCQ